MEKRRRARINASLAELKSLLLEAIKKEGARHNKMEKADILEMAVKHLRQIQRQQFTGEPSTDSVINKYHLGFRACAQEVSKYLGSNSDEDVELKTKLLNHLANCVTSGHFETMSSSPSSSSILSSPSSSSSVIPLSPLSLGSLSPISTTLSPEGQSSVRADCVKSALMITGEIPGLKVTVKDPQTESHGLVQRSSTEDPRPKLTYANSLVSSTSGDSTVLLKPHVLPVSHSEIFPKPMHPSNDKSHSNDNQSKADGESLENRLHVVPVTEINNNAIPLPSFINVNEPKPQAKILTQHHDQLQQQVHLQQQQLSHQHHFQQPEQHQQQQQQPMPSVVQESAGLFANLNLNRLQFIPTKTATGEVAYVLSANLVNSTQLPSYTIPILTPPTVNHAQLLAHPLPQQAIQIAVSYPQDERTQPITLVPQIAQPHFQSISSNTEKPKTPNHNLVPQQATPLNLSSSTYQSLHPSQPQITSRAISFSEPATVSLPATPRLITCSVVPPTTVSYGGTEYTSITTTLDSSAPPTHIFTSSASHNTNAKPLAEFPSSVQPTSVAIVKPHSTESDRSYDRQRHTPEHTERVKESHTIGSSSILEHGSIPQSDKSHNKRDASFFRPW